MAAEKTLKVGSSIIVLDNEDTYLVEPGRHGGPDTWIYPIGKRQGPYRSVLEAVDHLVKEEKGAS